MSQAEKVMQEFQRKQLEEQNAAVKATEKARRAARKAQQEISASSHSRFSKPLPAVPLHVSYPPCCSDTASKPVSKPRPKTLVVAIEPTTIRRRDATNRGRVPTQTPGAEWNRSDGRHRDKARPRQVKGMASGSWYQPAPAKRSLVPSANEQWYRPL